MEKIVEGKKATYRIWTELVKRFDGGVDIDVPIRYIAENVETKEIVTDYKINYPQNIDNTALQKQFEDFGKSAENDFQG